ncbi:MAG: peptidyl-prolyl cis-trans isomerase [Armatimonadetes bacterium]|nr:peptidyl-prolyl cis-trans isomerase [Armatimonadota bacterium]
MINLRQSIMSMVLLLAFNGPAMSQGASGNDNVDAPFIRVNDKVLSFAGFVARLELVPIQTAGGAKPIGEYTAEQIVSEMLILQLAAKKEAAPTDEQINKKIDLIKNEASGNIKDALSSRGMTLDNLKYKITVEQSYLNLVTQGVQVSDVEVKAAYDKMLKLENSPFKRPEQVMVSGIIVKDKAKADKIYKLLQDGEDFGTVAMQMSEDEPSKQVQGKLNWVVKGQQGIPPTIYNTAFSLPVGGFSKPMLIQGKYVILKADQKRPAKSSGFNDVKDLLREQLAVAEGAKRNTFQKDMQEFAVKSTISVASPRYSDIAAKLRARLDETLADCLKSMEREE